jgi:uncharacterized protein (DUF488 family)
MSEHPPPQEARWPEDVIFTLGHSTLPIEAFLALLQAYGIERLVDIRTIPRSRHNPQFNDTALASSLKARHLQYMHLKALGGLRRPRKDSPNTGWRNGGFRGFADYMQTEEFRDALAALIRTSRENRVAIMCAEAVPWRCHRSLVADALIVRGVPVVEILSESSYRMHELTHSRRWRASELPIPPSKLHCCKDRYSPVTRRPSSGNNSRSPSREAGQMPRSVISAVTRRAGVTSKA